MRWIIAGLTAVLRRGDGINLLARGKRVIHSRLRLNFAGRGSVFRGVMSFRTWVFRDETTVSIFPGLAENGRRIFAGYVGLFL